jgi:hypothetical protein
MRQINSKWGSFDFLTGLLAAYRFEDNLNDETGNYNGVFTHGTPSIYYDNSPIVGRCIRTTTLRFPCWQYQGDTTSFSFTSGGGNDLPFTICMWVSGLISANDRYLINKGAQSSTNDEWLFWVDSGGTPSASFIISNPTRTKTITWKYSTGIFGTGLSMNHLVITYDGLKTTSSLKLYKNGVLQAPLSAVNTGSYDGMTSGSQYFSVFKASAQANVSTERQWREGVMDNLYIYKNREFTAAEAAAMYAIELGGVNAVII